MRDFTAPWWSSRGAVALPRHLQSARGSCAATNQVAATSRGRVLRGSGWRAVSPVTVWVQVEGWPSATQGGTRPPATGLFFLARFSYATRYKHVVYNVKSRWHDRLFPLDQKLNRWVRAPQRCSVLDVIWTQHQQVRVHWLLVKLKFF